MTDGERLILVEVQALRSDLKDVSARVAVLERRNDLRTALISTGVTVFGIIVSAIAGCV